MYSSISKSMVGLTALVSLVSGGCALQSGDGSQETGTTENAGEASVKTASEAVTVSCDSSIYTSCIQTTDSTGSIVVRIYQCKFSGPAETNIAECPVEPGFVLVSGGAEIEGDTPSPGAFLTASFPPNGVDGNHVGTTWLARSKDQLIPFSHRLRAYAVGLQLQGVSAASLTNQIFYRVAESSTSSSAPTVTAVDTRAGDLIIGGGAEAVYHSAGQLLTASLASGVNGWLAASKDHGISDPGKVEAFVIGLPPCPTGYVRGCLHLNPATLASNPVGPGYASHIEFAGGVGVSVGAQVFFNGFGRMISSLFPVNVIGLNGVRLISKDQQVGDTGVDITQALGLAANQ